MSNLTTGENHSNILKYIQNEKDISRYKISFLEKNKELSPSQKRILNIEREFVSLPLEDILFQDLGDVAAAISIYRTSRSQFFEIYKIKKPETPLNKAEVAISVIKKIKFLKKTADDCKKSKVQSINLVQNSELYYDLIKKRISKNNNSIDIEKKFLDSKDLKFLLDIEPAVIAKKRARAQVAIYSIGQYISNNLPSLGDNNSLEDLIVINNKLDRIVKDIENEVFEFYNKSLVQLNNNLEGTMGVNRFLSKIHPLQNILDFDSISNRLLNLKPFSSAKNFNDKIPMVGNIFCGLKKVIATTEVGDADRNIQNKVFGIIIPLPHEGNEKMSILHKKIYIDNQEVSELFLDTFSNVKIILEGKTIYSKALMMHPFWRLKDIANKNPDYRVLISRLAGINLEDITSTFFNDKTAVDKINNKVCDFINISSNSRIYSPKTRSEEEGISEIYGIIKSQILEIQEEYRLISKVNGED